MATQRQKTAATKMVENGGNMNKKSKGTILRESGYSESIAKNPKKVMESKGWKELMEELLPNEELFQLHKEILGKKEVIKKGKKLITQPHRDVLRALDLAYKLRGAYSQEQEAEESSDEDDLSQYTSEELVEMIDLAKYGYFKKEGFETAFEEQRRRNAERKKREEQSKPPSPPFLNSVN